MRRLTALVATTVLALAFSASAGVAQQPQHHDATPPQPAAASAKPETAAPAMEGHMAQHMEMCREMMGQGGMMHGGMAMMHGPGMRGSGPGMMGPGMMGPGMMGGDPKQQAAMMAMRGEMMKAMGDIMMKYAHRMQPAK